MLRERPRVPLRLEQFAALQSAARRVREVTRELEIVFAEDAFLSEENDDETGGLARDSAIA